MPLAAVGQLRPLDLLIALDYCSTPHLIHIAGVQDPSEDYIQR